MCAIRYFYVMPTKRSFVYSLLFYNIYLKSSGFTAKALRTFT